MTAAYADRAADRSSLSWPRLALIAAFGALSWTPIIALPAIIQAVR